MVPLAVGGHWRTPGHFVEGGGQGGSDEEAAAGRGPVRDAVQQEQGSRHQPEASLGEPRGLGGLPVIGSVTGLTTGQALERRLECV